MPVMPVMPSIDDGADAEEAAAGSGVADGTTLAELTCCAKALPAP